MSKFWKSVTELSVIIVIAMAVATILRPVAPNADTHASVRAITGLFAEIFAPEKVNVTAVDANGYAIPGTVIPFDVKQLPRVNEPLRSPGAEGWRYTTRSGTIFFMYCKKGNTYFGWQTQVHWDFKKFSNTCTPTGSELLAAIDTFVQFVRDAVVNEKEVILHDLDAVRFFFK